MVRFLDQFSLWGRNRGGVHGAFAAAALGRVAARKLTIVRASDAVNRIDDVLHLGHPPYGMALGE
jgi:hypothetical protein